MNLNRFPSTILCISTIDSRLNSRALLCTESFKHKEQDVAHFGSPRLTIERADGDKGAVTEAENKRMRAYLRVAKD